MGTVNTYNVAWHFEQNGKIISSSYEANLSAAASDYNSLVTVINNNAAALQASGRATSWPNGTLVIESVQATPSGSQLIYS